jgi:hypothetical protein
MRNITLFIALFFAFAMNAQNFPGIQPQLLEGKMVKVRPLTVVQTYGYEFFFKDDDMYRIYQYDHGMSSKTEALLGRIFKVTSVIPDPHYPDRFYKITLQDEKGEIIYFRYDPKYEEYYFFEVIGGLDLPPDFYCDYINEEVVSHGYKAYSINKNYDVIAIKKETNLKTGKVEYQMKVQTSTAKPVTTPEGITIFFENGKKIEYPSQYVTTKDKIYMTFVILTKSDIEIFKNNNITNIQILNFPQDIDTEYAESFRGRFNCLVTDRF